MWEFIQVLLLLSSLHIHGVSGSAILFDSNPPEVKKGLTDELKLRCSLNDTSASSAVIGRRDVIRTDDNTADISSILIIKGGQDVAVMSHDSTAHVFNAPPLTTVSGNLHGTTGYLELTIPNPSNESAGEYRCEIHTDSSGHVLTYAKALEISAVEPTIADLVQTIHNLKENDKLQKQLNTKVFFSASLPNSVTVATGHVVLFDKVYSNVGNDYNPSNGQFVCEVAGFYEFTVSALAVPGHSVNLVLTKNGVMTVSVYGSDSTSYDGSSNTVTLPLGVGDVVKVVARSTSVLHSAQYCTFSGQLLQMI